jgi:two-component system chemotaxis response regulator CheB
MKNRVIVIGASYGGIAALKTLVSALPADLPAAVFVVQHIGARSPSYLPQILTSAGPLPAVTATDGEHFREGRIYVAPPDRHMLLRDGTILLSTGPKENWSRPAIDPLFRSAAILYGAAVVGVILTGQLDDGTAGLMSVKDHGGVAIVQNPEEAAAPSMPSSALRYVDVDHSCNVTAIAALIVRLANDDWSTVARPAGDLTAVENRIAAGFVTNGDWEFLENHSADSRLSCPGCDNPMYELMDPRVLRFRCRAGHAFSPEALLAANDDRRERLLASRLGQLTGEAMLARKILRRPEYGADPGAVRRLTERAAELEAEAAACRAEFKRALETITP